MTKEKRSIKLTEKERISLSKMLSSYPTMTEASIKIGVGREVLIRTNILGSCSPKTYNQIFK